MLSFNPNKKIAGILAPLFALRGKEDLGIGDTAALAEAVQWASENGFHAFQLLPINESGESASPYNVISAMALEPSTITTHPSWIPELSFSDYTKITSFYDLPALQKERVDYTTVRKLKRELLTAAWKSFKKTNPYHERYQQYLSFQEQESAWLPHYTLYRVLLEQHHNNDNISSWDRPLQQASTALSWLKTLPKREQEDFEEQRSFFSYVQWIALEQWKKVSSLAENYGVALIGDVPTGINSGSADVFSNPSLFDTTLFGGAPPEKVFSTDAFTEKWGQNWGVPLYRWEQMAHDNFAWWRLRLRRLRSFFHALRIDHTLGLFRIYSFPWKPEEDSLFINLTPEEAMQFTGGILPHFVDHNDDTEEHCYHNQRRGEILLQVFLEEVGENRLIAEDLGVVPSYVAPTLIRLGVPGLKIPLWTRTDQGSMIEGQNYPRTSVATYATHDHAPLRKQWEAWQKKAIKEGPSSSSLKTLQEMLHFIGWSNKAPLMPYQGELHHQFLRALYATNSWLTMVLITDLFGEDFSFNIPGVSSEKNWTARSPFPIGTWNKLYHEVLAASYLGLQTNDRFQKK